MLIINMYINMCMATCASLWADVSEAYTDEALRHEDGYTLHEQYEYDPLLEMWVRPPSPPPEPTPTRRVMWDPSPPPPPPPPSRRSRRPPPTSLQPHGAQPTTPRLAPTTPPPQQPLPADGVLSKLESIEQRLNWFADKWSLQTSGVGRIG
eukprot:GHVS01108567.1.p1 GENE.GHVS01108567.1~~GHVS01108567.1.p1  ORF type:complete len:151 (+),score=31.61 GHVS01108567.1:191-643(+)